MQEQDVQGQGQPLAQIQHPIQRNAAKITGTALLPQLGKGWVGLFFNVKENSSKNTHLPTEFKPHGPGFVSNLWGAHQN